MQARGGGVEMGSVVTGHAAGIFGKGYNTVIMKEREDYNHAVLH